MKILIATGIFIPEVGGPATYANKIAKELLALGHQVQIITYSDKSEYEVDKKLPYSVFRIKRSNKLINYWNYFKTLKKVAKDTDVVYSFDHFSAGIPSALYSMIFKKDFYIKGSNTEEPLTGIIKYINSELLEKGLKEGDTICFQPESEYPFIVEEEKLYRMFTNNITMVL